MSTDQFVKFIPSTQPQRQAFGGLGYINHLKGVTIADLQVALGKLEGVELEGGAKLTDVIEGFLVMPNDEDSFMGTMIHNSGTKISPEDLARAKDEMAQAIGASAAIVSRLYAVPSLEVLAESQKHDLVDGVISRINSDDALSVIFCLAGGDFAESITLYRTWEKAGKFLFEATDHPLPLGEGKATKHFSGVPYSDVPKVHADGCRQVADLCQPIYEKLAEEARQEKIHQDNIAAAANKF